MTGQDSRVFTCLVDGPVLRTGGDAMDLLAETFGRRLVVLGDIGEHVAASTALRDLVHECNRGRQTLFLADAAEPDARLRSERTRRSP